MKRKNFIYLCFLALVTLLAITPALADITVIGADNPAIDIPAVQNAVDGGETVILHGTFDFGETFVSIHSDVVIEGEKENDQYLTIIKGGKPAFSTYDEVDATISKLHFQRPIGSAITVAAANEVIITNNKITDPLPVIIFNPGIPDFQSLAFSISVSEYGYMGGDNDLPGQIPPPGSRAEGFNSEYGWSPAAVKSIWRVTIENNVIERQIVCDGFFEGIYVADILKEDKEKYIKIRNNIYRSISGEALGWLDWGIQVAAVGAVVKIESNTISNVARGIHFDGHFFYYHASSGHTIKSNTLENCYERGLSLSGVSDSVIKNNEIGMNPLNDPNGGDVTGIWLKATGKVGSNKNFVIGNKLFGSATHGIRIGRDTEYPLNEHNNFKKNDLSEIHCDKYGIEIAAVANNNLIKKTTIGSVGEIGLFSNGTAISVKNITFIGDYDGWTGELDPNGDPIGKGFIALGRKAKNSKLTAVKKGTPPHGSDLCEQVIDLPGSEIRTLPIGFEGYFYGPDKKWAVPFGDLSRIKFNIYGAPYLEEEDVVEVPYYFESAGFENDDPTSGLVYQRSNNKALNVWFRDLYGWFGHSGVYYLVYWEGFTKDFDLVLTDLPEISLPWGDSYPDPNGTPVAPYLPKNNKVPGYNRCRSHSGEDGDDD